MVRDMVLRGTMLIAVAAAAGCASLASSPGMATVNGRAIYPQSGVLLSNSVLQVQLLDVSRQDARAELIAETLIPLEGRRPPIEFRLAYPREAIKPAHVYSVRATINAGDRLLFTTSESYRVLTRDAPDDVTVRLHSVRGGVSAPNR